MHRSALFTEASRENADAPLYVYNMQYSWQLEPLFYKHLSALQVFWRPTEYCAQLDWWQAADNSLWLVKNWSTCSVELKRPELNRQHNLINAVRADTIPYDLCFIFNILCFWHFHDMLQFIASPFLNTVFLLESLNFHIFSLFPLEVKCTRHVIHVIRSTPASLGLYGSTTFALHVWRVLVKQPWFISIYFDQCWGCGDTGNKTAHLFDMKADDY